MEPKVFTDVKGTVLSNNLLIILFPAIMKLKEIIVRGTLPLAIPRHIDLYFPEWFYIA